MAESDSKAEEIRRLAYERWEQTGRQDGLEAEHWRWAEAEYAQRLQASPNGQPVSEAASSNGQLQGDVSEAPESGTVRDNTSGNQTAAPQERPAVLKPKRARGKKAAPADDPAVAGEER